MNEGKPFQFPVILLLSFILIGCFLNSCTFSESTNPVLIFDIIDCSKDHMTDTLFDKNRTKKLLLKYAPKNTDIEYHSTTIGSTSVNTINELTLPKKALIENPLNRNDQVSDFSHTIDSKIRELFKRRAKGNEERSLIYEGFCHLANSVKNDTLWDAHKVTFILNSDGLQNSTFFSFYGINPNEFDPIPEQVQKITTQLEKSQCVIPDLSGIKIIFEYQTNHKNELMVSKVRLFWKQLFESKGATVIFTSNL